MIKSLNTLAKFIALGENIDPSMIEIKYALIDNWDEVMSKKGSNLIEIPQRQYLFINILGHPVQWRVEWLEERKTQDKFYKDKWID